MTKINCAIALMLMGIMVSCAHNDRRVEENEAPVTEEPRPVMPEERSAPDAEPPPIETMTEEEFQMALDRALGAALAAGGDSPCERSFNAMLAMRDSLVRDLGEAVAQDLPSKRRFIEACEQLPEDAQRCMDIGFAMDNQEECQRVMEAVPPEQRRPLEELLQG